jgi:hypothetical protein
MLMALAFLQALMIAEGFREIIEQAETWGVGDLCKDLFKYFNEQWMKKEGVNAFCVFGHKNRTNNAIESFHRLLNNFLPSTHPNFWVFVGIYL